MDTQITRLLGLLHNRLRGIGRRRRSPGNRIPNFDNNVPISSRRNANADDLWLSRFRIQFHFHRLYLRGSMAAILSVLQHSSCPENIIFHLVSSVAADTSHLNLTVTKSFPYLQFNIYPFDDSPMARLISTSIRAALDRPLNYARNYMADMLPECIQEVVYLDSDLVLVDDIAKLVATPLGTKAILAALEYCNANLTSYFTPKFWSNPSLSLTFSFTSSTSTSYTSTTSIRCTCPTATTNTSPNNTPTNSTTYGTSSRTHNTPTNSTTYGTTSTMPVPTIASSHSTRFGSPT
ncbi:unnamed protein product [Fraxinus pennsylvanica]|uniref:Hexosyltransferase n=1 Tax=Fraxinus pennsylvanica TaxID=56036 RepID=A0AAD1YV35_9LAMI|nr:unnamed protein product [Fraxinus pennsylvanica]